MRVFVTGASGYIGGSVAAALVADGHQVSGLVRTSAKATALSERGIEPVLGTLDDADILAAAARAADAVINTANSDHRGSAEALIAALASSGKPLIHTSGSSIVADDAEGRRSKNVFADDTPFDPVPEKAPRVAIDRLVLAGASRGVRPVVLCPTLIYGHGSGLHRDSIHLPALVAQARKSGIARYVGPGENLWSNVHIDDVVAAYRLALAKVPSGEFMFVENGEESFKAMVTAIARRLGCEAESWPIEAAIGEWGRVKARFSLASNSRVRAVKARALLGWSPKHTSIVEAIERGEAF